MNDFLFSILAWIQSWVGSWGWSMVVFTILVRLVLTPFDIKSRVSMRKTQKLQPQQMALQNAFNGAIGDVFRSSVRSWKKVIQHYVLENTDFLIRMMPEIEFVTKATELLV